MLEPDKRSKESSGHDLRTFSFDVKAESSQGGVALENFQLNTASEIDLAEALLVPIPTPQESPDDVFAERFGVIARGRIALDPEAADVVDKTVLSVISEGLFDLDSAEAQGISIRRGGSGALSDRLSVGWVSYTDAQTQSSLLPDFNAVQAIANAESPALSVDVQGVERFTAAEARVLVIGEGDDIALGVFVPSACRAEAIEHFTRAVAGSGEPSFLYSALEQELVRVLDGETAIGSEYYQEVLTWIRANLTGSVVSFDSTTSCFGAAESVVLELRMIDPESDVFMETFGKSTLTCKVSFGDPGSALVERPSFQWL